jgi:hypothetical protein
MFLLEGPKRSAVAVSEAVEEIKFLYFLLHDIRIDGELSIVVKTDKIGA